MTTSDWIAISPIVAGALTAVVIMLAIAFSRHRLATLILALGGTALAFLLLPLAASQAPRQITPLVIIDDFALFYMGLILMASMVVALLAYGYLRREPEEFYLMLLLATTGALVIVASNHFVSFFLGLEILSVSLYVLIAYPRHIERAIEAAIKYLVLAAAAAAFLLFGMALLYTETGTMEFPRLAAGMSGAGAREGLLLTGQAMIFIGIGFKLAIVPFHFWAPDVYQGAPAPVTAFVATVSKGAVLALLLRYFASLDEGTRALFYPLLTVVAIASMFIGNLLALVQESVKRILAYSSIAHLGYLMVAFLAGGSMGATAVAFYLAAYFVTTLAAFGVITALSNQELEADGLENYRGLFWRRQGLAVIFTLTLLSLGGIPLTAGFMGKLYVVLAGVNSTLWLAVVMLAINTAISFYYYLRIAFTMFRDAPATGEAAATGSLSLAPTAGVVLLALALLLLWLGVYPDPLIHTIQAMVASLMR